MAGKPLIEAHNLVKTYALGGQSIDAVAGVSLAVERGEFLAIMGASGSGKSTFMNLLGALDTPTSGALVFDGEDIGGLSRDALAQVRNRKIGFVFQQFNLLARTSAIDNVAVPLVYGGVPRAERRARAQKVLGDMGLADRLEHTPAKLSGGQQQRVAIARALVTDPLLLLADEPTGALDSATSREIMAIFQGLNAQGITIVLVTHERDVAAYAQRCIRFEDGRIAASGPAATV